MGVTTQKTSRSLSSDFGFLKKKTKKEFGPHPRKKNKEKEKTSENITFIFSPQNKIFFAKKII
jgi:hypothetical protein